MASVAPRPTLMFAIASDDPQAVRAVLANGEVGPNDQIGPQSALEFALTTGSLTNRTEIVKTLLEYGAEPPSKAEQQRTADPTASSGQSPPPAASSILDSLDPATRYYVQKAGDENTRRNSALIHRSFFRPLTRVRYDLIGQDRALEQLFRVLSMHSQQFSVAPVVVLLCGPSGHGKTYLAQKFGSLLKVPSITVNMTTLRNAQDLWQAYSTDPDSTASNHTLADFLLENEGKRCVVLLDEIEKTQDDKALWALHMPWEMGRCAFEAGRRHVDVRNVIWLATSNIGQELIFEHHSSRREQEFSMTREEYLDLMASLRPQVSGRLGTSLLSRVTTVLPFVPFTEEERMAIAGEAALHVGGDMARSLPPETMRHIVKQAAGAGYIPSEGARSLYRDVAVRLMDAL
ncbi:P-loop containing nucleoside triphosphate hydrolase protein [Punctularia strigosozonata HHB-11173 SS5]|uniref:P-loop containing nucleoside triphosphate hydrolase protein n=1 Tax=Punctularia strigosozonata (strain HHB-11173) TaxID=741275 RepID=UPI00044171B4|nr:P-loop containing nucleoside triphosphate hydrolase protein [Punctularia strigosozonata HHB-11173 SS5]EIN07081.1 P-loop containing nucleoside triphosphate hydrolase protein [Punctularia strigosozonata HHB-11173 SS5]